MKNLCLNYHDFSGTKSKTYTKSKYTVSFDVFLQQLNILSKYQNIPLLDLLSDEPVSGLSYSLTFDDGLKSNLYVAEELAKRNLKGTFFVIKNESLGNSRFLDVNDIKEIDKLGMEIGSHSCSHQHMNRLNYRELVNELNDSKCFLEDTLSKGIASFAYPGGHFGTREIKASLNAGYLINRTCITGLNSHPLQKGIVKCITITEKTDLNTFKNILNLSPLFFARKKIRELALVMPKYIESVILSKQIKKN